MERLLLLTDEMQYIPPLLVPKLIDCLGQRNDIEIVAACVPQIRSGFQIEMQWRLRRLERSIQKRTISHKPRWPWPEPRWLRKLAKQVSFAILAPDSGNFADPKFITTLRNKYRPTLIINCYCLAKFPPKLLALCDMAVNYHNGKLPEYRGVRATNLSVYYDDKITGYAFHRMTEQLDDGPLLVEGGIPVASDMSVFDLEHAKAIVAAQRFPEVLEAMVTRQPGKPQQGKVGYFSRKDWRKIRTIAVPGELSAKEILRRLRAFSLLKITIEGRVYDVTGLTQTVPGYDSHSFQSADGIWLRPTHYGFLPYAMYAPLRRLVWRHR